MLPAGDRAGSFPSNHASKAEVYSMLVSRNIDSLPVSNVNKTALKIGTFGLDLGTAWARVEGKRHFSSDVFAGMAPGHFLGAFFTDAFLGLGHPGDGGIFLTGFNLILTIPCLAQSHVRRFHQYMEVNVQQAEGA
jgi:hypothetical protein